MELSAIKKFIQAEEVKYKAAISEVTARKMGQMMNFLGRRLHETKRFDLNGPYYVAADPQIGVDGLSGFEFDAEIFNIWIFNLVPGSSGTTELDLKRATTPGGTFTSIFSVTPKVSSAAAANTWCKIGDTVTGCTAPVLTSFPFNVNAGDVLRLDKLNSMPGAQNCGLLVHYRPR